MTKVFKAYSKDGRWIKLAKGGYKAKVEAGIPVGIFHENGGYFTIANADKLPEGVPAKFSAKAEAKAKAKAEAVAQAEA